MDRFPIRVLCNNDYMALVRGTFYPSGLGLPGGECVSFPTWNSSSCKLSGNTKCEHPTTGKRKSGGGGGRLDMELMIVFMQAANNTAQFPAGISTCALFISWFCYVRNVEVEKEISNINLQRKKIRVLPVAGRILHRVDRQNCLGRFPLK